MNIRKAALVTMIFCNPLWATPVTLADKKTIADIFEFFGYKSFQKHTKFAKQITGQQHSAQSLLTALEDAIQKSTDVTLCSFSEAEKAAIMERILASGSIDQSLVPQQVQDLHAELEVEPTINIQETPSQQEDHSQQAKQTE